MLIHIFDTTKRTAFIAEARKHRYSVIPHKDNPHSLEVYQTKANTMDDFDWLNNVESEWDVSCFAHSNKAQANVLVPRVKIGELVEKDLPNQKTDRTKDIVSKAASPNFKPTELFNVYRFPSLSNVKTSPNVAIIQLGGGYRQKEMTYYWTTVLGYPKNSIPKMFDISINSAKNNPGSDADFEVSLDAQVIGGLFPNGKVNMYVYFAPNTFQGFYNAIQSAIYNTKNPYTVISISWGAPEIAWGTSNLNAFNQLFAQAVAKGITIFVASGDYGSTDGVNDGNQHVDYPAGSPNVIACGGTYLVCPSRTYTAPTTQETAWSGSGGGYSSLFPPQAFQGNAIAGLTITNKRCVPDIAGAADPNSGWLIYLRNNLYAVGGTSAVSPMWSALWANCIGTKSRKFAGPTLYNGNAAQYNDIKLGNNGAYSANVKYDLCTGLGSPNGTILKTKV